MTLCRAVLVAALALGLPLAPAAAQFQPQPPQQGQIPPCVKGFITLRNDVQKKGEAIKASEHKVTAQVACKLLDSYSVAEEKMLTYAEKNSVWCGIPSQLVANIKKSHVQTVAVRTRVCRIAAAGPPRPAGPSLSDALDGPIPDASNIKTGQGGTFDTLTGTPLGEK
jgi:hypothetical protein